MFNHSDRQRINHAQFEIRVIRENILGVIIRHARGDNSDFRIVDFHPVFGKRLHEMAQRLLALFHLDASHPGIDGHHDVL